MNAEIIGYYIITGVFAAIVIVGVALILTGVWRPSNARLGKLQVVLYVLLLVAVLWRALFFALRHHS